MRKQNKEVLSILEVPWLFKILLNYINIRIWNLKSLLSKSESVKFSLIELVKFSLIESVICLFTDASVKKIFFTVKSVKFHWWLVDFGWFKFWEYYILFMKQYTCVLDLIYWSMKFNIPKLTTYIIWFTQL